MESSKYKTMDKFKFPMMDLHVHRSENLTIEDIVAKSQQLNMKIGVMENIAPWGITNDAQLKEYINAIKPYPVYIGLQPMSPGWSKNLSSELIAQADYIAMDPQIVTKGNGYGETIMLWEYDAYIDDPDEFMKRNMQHYMDILTGSEPLDVFACPLFLPCCIQRKYDILWTKKRLQQIVDAARSRDIAIEINDTAHVPHEDFILMAKKAGLKFVFGSDSRNHTVGRLDYCKRIAQRCNLTEEDFFIPKRYRS
ncbi:PHP domain-containing protein [Parabacteroides chinchillae]|uniref:Histidinol phosphatase n=1 Tax=Parabacteroides chinchillae TaxID=871327 RepID=A0A8G2BY75_9BACT|nr:hypothetical protein [Parabacteroides chinchillae]SEG15591.1 Histidinol phosphatase [Parabacteroides chinchillae]